MPEQVPLLLESFFVENLTYQARQNFDRTQPPNESVRVDVKALSHKDDANRFMTRLHVSVGLPESRNPRCELNMDLVGFFVLPPGVTGDLRNAMIALNAPSILYGVARQIVAETTGNGPWGKVFLQTVNFAHAQNAAAHAKKQPRASAVEPIVCDRPRATKK